MKSFFRFVLLSLVLLTVALVSALTAMRFAIHGREVAVPNLVGKSPAEARRLAESNGFSMDVERQFYSPSVPEGYILSQVPESGTLIRRGWQIRVAQSIGPQRVQIPNVLGESQRAAEITITRRGLDVSAISQIPIPTAPPDQVIAQSPSPNASNVAAPRIGLLTAQPVPPPAFVMPNFIGQSLGNATAVLTGAGFHVGRVSEIPLLTLEPPPAAASAPQTPNNPSPPESSLGSIIVSQVPVAGSKIVVGATVNFEVR